jgi:hypothetical protein
MKKGRGLLCLVLLFVSGCGHATGGSSPTVPSVSSPYSIVGTVRYYRGGPAAGITVRTDRRGGVANLTTETDPEGRFRFDGISGGGVNVWLELQNDYRAEEIFNIGQENSPRDFILYPRVVADIGGGFIDSSIAGDQLLGPDMYGGLCAHVACRLVEIGGAGGPQPAAQVRITLRWNNPASRLGLYIPTSAYYPVPVQRLCCGSELTGTFTLTGGDFDAFLVGFEEFAGHRPETDDVQPFQVSVAF